MEGSNFPFPKCEVSDPNGQYSRTMNDPVGDF
jgi:hypothetical protein